MNMPPNTLVKGIIAACRDNPFQEKLLLAPSSRIGRQWLDQAASYGLLAVNIRIGGVTRLIRDLAGPGLNVAGLNHPTPVERYAIIKNILASDRTGVGYFSSLKPTLSVLRMMDHSFSDLANAGVRHAEALLTASYPRKKAEELSRLYALFQVRMENGKFAGPARIFAEAVAALKKQKQPAFLLIPRDLQENLTGLEKQFIELWPKKRQMPLPVDTSVKARLSFRVADGDMNEARNVFRTVVENKLRLDEVEVAPITTAGVTAVCAAAFEYFSNTEAGPSRIEDLPLTFADGIPGGISRPERLLDFWLNWLGTDRLAGMLAEACTSGLLREERFLQSRTTAGKMRSFLLALRAEPGARGILRALDAWRGNDTETADLCRALARDILAPLADDKHGEAAGILASAKNLLENWCGARGELDNYALVRLLEDDFLSGAAKPWPEFDAHEWLVELTRNMRLMGQGPQPGKLHVSSLLGGHSGRAATFVTHLDEGSFPGGDVQDPVLLDSERKKLSEELVLSGERRNHRENELQRLLSRIRGVAYLSCSRVDIATTGELYPCDAFLEKLHAADAAGTVQDLTAVSEPFIPADPERALDDREYVMAKLLPVSGDAGVIAVDSLYPWLARGRAAVEARKDHSLNGYNGHIPEVGTDFINSPRLFSASQLECLSRCQLEYYFKHVLQLAEPDRYHPERHIWLEANERGSLLHQLYSTYLRKIRDNAEAGSEEMLQAVFDETLGRWVRDIPPRDRLIFERERRDLYDAGRIFLHEELKSAGSADPVYLEAVFGMKAGDDEELLGDAVEISLPSGRWFRLRGRIDRVDRLKTGGLAIWDYKTGKPAKYAKDTVFSDGMNLQAGLYMVAMEKLGKGREQVEESGYYFPTRLGGGMKVKSVQNDLQPVLDRIDALLAMIEQGEFPFDPLDKSQYDPGELAPLFT
jgi:ATP-dependent nuclease, subunit B